MVRRTKTVLTDDLDGSELAEGAPSIRFSLDGVAYEIDLSTENESALRATLASYVAAGRRRHGGRGLRRSP